MKYLIKLFLQVLLYVIVPFGRIALLAYHGRVFLKAQHFKFCYVYIGLSLSALVVYSVYSDFFPSLLAVIIGIILNIKFSKPLYKKISRMRQD